MGPNWKIDNRSMTRVWGFGDGITVAEMPGGCCGQLLCYRDGIFIGRVVPADMSDMEECVAKLDAGEDPVTGGWDDGNGNACSAKGWSPCGISRERYGLADECAECADASCTWKVRLEREEAEAATIREFKEKTERMMHRTGDICQEGIEHYVREYCKDVFEENGVRAEITGIAVVGSRSRGLEWFMDDIDVAVELDTDEREDDLTSMLNGGNCGMGMYGIAVDFIPITRRKSGSLAAYLEAEDRRLDEIMKSRAAKGQAQG